MANENNTTEKVDYTKNLKEVGAFVNDKVKPLIGRVIASKTSVKEALDKIARVKEDLTRQAQEELQRKEEEEKALAPDAASDENQPSVEEHEEEKALFRKKGREERPKGDEREAVGRKRYAARCCQEP